MENVKGEEEDSNVDISLILDDSEKDVTCGPQIRFLNCSNRVDIVIDVLIEIYPYDLERYLKIIE